MESPIGAKFNVTVEVGKQSIEKLTDALVDIFSATTETLGLLGDSVRLARVSVAAAITRRAKAIADQNALKLTMPPLKFLGPFFEKASTENLEDHELVEMWANLLASAGDAFDGRYQAYTSILSKLNGQQAQIIHGMARNSKGDEIDEVRLECEFVESVLVSEIKKYHVSNSGELIDKILEYISISGTSIILVSAGTTAGNEHLDYTPDDIYRDDMNIDFNILQSYGILHKITTGETTLARGGFFFYFSMYRMTEFGVDFWQTCSGGKFSRDN